MKQSKVLPDLQMLVTKKLIPHEEADPRRVKRLSERILEEGILKNPPIVAELPDSDRYVILDGANRVMAFTLLRIPHIVAQVVSYDNPDLILDTWYHVVSGLEFNEFEEAILSIDGMHLKECSLAEARRALDSNEVLAYIVYENGVRTVNYPGNIEHTRKVLVEMVNTYKGKADIYRASNDIWEKQKPYYPQITALVIFPRYRPQDILHCAQNGYKVPTNGLWNAWLPTLSATTLNRRSRSTNSISTLDQ